jgi:hypothetical protein
MEEKTNKVVNRNGVLSLISEGVSLKRWDYDCEVTREECGDIAKGKPWKLMRIATDKDSGFLDHPVMWEGMADPL